jgi:hypothetical protein
MEQMLSDLAPSDHVEYHTQHVKDESIIVRLLCHLER